MIEVLGWVVLLLPLVAAIVLALPSGEPSRPFSRALGVAPIAAAFAATVAIFISLLGRDEEDRLVTSTLWEWIAIGDLSVDLALQIDALSVLMSLVITGVGALIFIYSTEYMEHDRDYRRFFAEMNFFVFSMLLLVLAANFVFLIVGWALVGLASYLLIGYYYDKPTAVAAARKAFVINVIGDVGLVLAAFILVRELGTLDFAGVFSGAEGLSRGDAELVGLLLFVGAAAKSAQVPLHTWLADAMEGPTPVSALIHAATMVTAGVYLIVRSHAIFEVAPSAADVVAITGAVTLLFAATVATVQVDIKRVLAWSTVSQIGYMIMAAGLGAYVAAMFHFLTHAFFKALLFLAAGIVIHALAGEQSIDRMGGLVRHLHLAWFATLVGVLAIIGVPGFSGFFSKDEILASAYDEGGLGIVLWVVGTVAAALTAFYMLRLFIRVFHGPPPGGGYASAPHPSGAAMAIPVAILAFLSLVGGWIQIPGGWHLMEDWLHPVLADAPESELSGTAKTVSVLGSLAAVLAGAGMAWWVFLADPGRRERLASRFLGARSVLNRAWLFDEIYDATAVAPTRELGDTLLRTGEPGVAQGIVTGSLATVGSAGRVLGRVQTGLVRSYAFAMVAGVVVVALIVLVVTNPGAAESFLGVDVVGYLRGDG